MFKRILTAVVFIAALAFSAFFTWLNPGVVNLDLGFGMVESPIGLSFIVALAAGWLLGVLSAAFWVARVAADRRRLRKELKNTSAGGLAVRDERG